ncbi:glycosyltransferase [Vibrio cholerae]|nr:glycosyltransferase [Vibrio cholerae]ELP4888450.1 glycosyltransferase [Vibrio cholerae]ELT8461796.1 glycosyltransferase [Vibrio cholerae]EMA8959584.1 glycosyltransferase [Vibrio fluvialis]
MKKIFVNASAAKSGGAAAILNKFVAAKENENNVKYIIASPIKPMRLGENHIWVEKSTSLFGTIFYAMFGSWFDSKKYNCQSIISFSNINSILPSQKITYFHNMLILTSNSIKWTVIRNLMKLTLRNNKFIVQTPYVKKQFHYLYGQQCNVKVKWPGVDILESSNVNINDLLISLDDSVFNILVPIPDIDLEHKNFSLVLKLAKRCLGYPIQFLVTTENKVSQNDVIENVRYIGKKNRCDYQALLDFIDATIVTSTLETVGLPIFESLAHKKYCFVFKQDYLEGITELFGDLGGLLTFSDEEEFIQAYHKANDPFPNFESSFRDGDWNF